MIFLQNKLADLAIPIKNPMLLLKERRKPIDLAGLLLPKAREKFFTHDKRENEA